MTDAPRPGQFSVIRTDAGYHAIVAGAQGEPVWTTEVHPEREDAVYAITFLRDTLAVLGNTLAVQYHDHRSPDEDKPHEGFAHGSINLATP